MSRKKEIVILSIIFAIFILTQFVFSINLKVDPTWDFGTVYNTAVSFGQTGYFNEMGYYVLFPNNIGLLLVLSFFFRIGHFLGINNFYAIGIVLNIISISISVLFIYLIVKKKLGLKMAFVSLTISLLILAFYTYTPIFYTDTMSLPYMLMLIYFIECIDVEKSKKLKKILYYLCIAIICFIGYKIKVTVIICFIAIFIYHLLFRLNIKKLIIIIMFIIPLNFLFNSLILDKLNSRSDSEPIPYTHWIMMGMNNKSYGGYYDNDCVNITLTVETKDQRKNLNISEIKRRLEEFKFSGYMKFLATKANITWGDGTYFAPEKLRREPIKKSFLHEFILINGRYFDIYYTFCQIVHLTIIITISFSSFLVIRNKKYAFAFPALLSVLGIFIFLLIWETRSRYLVNFIPIFIVCATVSFEFIFEKINKRIYNINNEERN